MLYSNEFNIKKVSDIYHFPSQSFFGRYFKRIVGMSPTAYIKENNSKAIIEG
jgi:AraC-like DNA-binding protein